VWSLAIASGEQCAPASGSVSFWREDATDDTSLHLKRMSTGDEVTIAWPADTDSIVWPESVELTDGEMYLVRYAGAVRSKDLTIKQMPASIATDVQAIAWLSTHGCKCQAEALYQNLSQSPVVEQQEYGIGER